MFKRLVDFGYERTPREALGFYLAYFVLGILTGALSGGILGLFSSADSVQTGISAGVCIGAIIAVVLSVSVPLLVLYEKGLLNNFLYIMLVILSGLLALFVDGLGGLIPAAFLTTRKSEAQ